MSESSADDIDFGPLAALVGKWEGDKGLDISPEPDDTEKNAYFETIEFRLVGDVTNAEKQDLAILSYHQSVSRHKTGKEFHNQMGYWSWHAASGTLYHSFAIPRGVAVVAEGHCPEADEDGNLEFTVSVGEEDALRGIAQSKFMDAEAKTLAFSQTMTLKDGTLRYEQKTVLDIYGRRFDHTDVSRLVKVSG